MEYTHLGRTGLQVSRLCLGTMNFGPFASEAESFAIMDKALELGINFFDTANVYGRVKGEGVTEQIIGRWLAQGGGRREKIVLATKVYGGMGDWPNESKLSAYHIRRACEESLRRLQTDHIDLYQMHHIDRETPWEEIWQAMETAGAAGQSDLRGQQQLRRLAHRAGARRSQGAPFHGAGLRTKPLQSERAHDRTRSHPRLQALWAGPDSVESAGGGLLGGALQKAAEGRRARRADAKTIEKNRAKLEAYEALCQKWANSPPTWRWPGCSTTRS